MVHMIKKYLAIILLLTVSNLFSQELPKDLGGEELKMWIKENYYRGKHKALSYKQARIYMYNFIDNYNNKIICVYSGYVKDWDYGGTDSNPDPVNCEHTVPQSFFKSNKDSLKMKSDLHHLFPTYKNWNSIRSSYKLGEVDDNVTQKWMIDMIESYEVPKENVDNYSEYAYGVFEPAEEHKGNVARAIFYFYTMYNYKDIKNLDYVGNIETLYQWHINDPVDKKELERNDKIEKYQGNRNPYIDYPYLVKLAFMK